MKRSTDWTFNPNLEGELEQDDEAPTSVYEQKATTIERDYERRRFIPNDPQSSVGHHNCKSLFAPFTTGCSPAIEPDCLQAASYRLTEACRVGTEIRGT